MQGKATKPMLSVTAGVGFLLSHINASASRFPTPLFARTPQEVCSASVRPSSDFVVKSSEVLTCYKALGVGEQVQGSVVCARARAAPVHKDSLLLGATIALTPLAFHPTNIVPIFFCNIFQWDSVGNYHYLKVLQSAYEKHYKAEAFKLPFVVGVGGLDTAQKGFSRWLHTAGQTYLKLAAIMLYDIILMDKSCCHNIGLVRHFG